MRRDLHQVKWEELNGEERDQRLRQILKSDRIPNHHKSASIRARVHAEIADRNRMGKPIKL
jgi:hypothetical protein